MPVLHQVCHDPLQRCVSSMCPCVEKLGAQTNQFAVIELPLLVRQLQIQKSINVDCYTTAVFFVGIFLLFDL